MLWRRRRNPDECTVQTRLGLAAAHQRPLDRIRLMKSLFLTWHRTERRLKDFYEFTPYLYGSCSFDLYRELEALLRERPLTEVWQVLPTGMGPLDESKVAALSGAADQLRENEVQLLFGELPRGNEEYVDLAAKGRKEGPA